MNYLPKISVEKIFHRNQNHIGIRFAYNKELISVVRSIPDARWSQSKKTWYIGYSDENYELLKTCFKNKATVNDNGYFEVKKKTSATPKRELTQFQKDILNGFYKYLKGKRYSKSTIDTYIYFTADFIAFCKDKPLDLLSDRDVELFIETVFIKRDYSISSQRQFISALKLFIVYEPSTQINVLELTRPKRDKKLPTVLSQLDLIKLISQTKNLKHRAVLALLYASGLRIGELLNLKLSEIDVRRRQIFVRNGKGRKDRYCTIADSFLPLLNNYLNTYRPKLYFVEGADYKKYSASSIRKFLHKNASQCGIKTKVTPHTLRHSYATHLLEKGVSLRHIQTLLGHSKPETTMIYTHVARKDLLDIKSPLDYALEELKQLDKSEQKFLLSGT